MSSWTEKTRMMLEMIRFSHTVFALPFALLAAVLAWQTPTASGQTIGFRGQDLLGILVCMVTARSAAMAFNRLVDHQIDAANPRTAARHIPAGILSRRSVAVFTTLNAIAFVMATLLFLPNRLPLFLSLPVLAVLMLYSYAKRLGPVSHYWLGFALMLAPVAVWIALRGQVVIEHPEEILPALTLGLAVLFWVGGFDIIYACQDYEFDRQNKLHSLPARCGIAGALRIAAASHLVMIVMLLVVPVIARAVGLEPGLGWIYYSGVIAVGGLLVYEHALVRPDDLTRVNQAFFNVNAIVSFGLFLTGALDTLV